MLENYGVHDFVDSELDYIATVLEEDSKNYHAWSYRQWIVQAVDTTAAWEKEIQYGKSDYSSLRCGILIVESPHKFSG